LPDHRALTVVTKLEEPRDKRPDDERPSRVRALEQDADVVLFLFRPEQYGEVPNDKKSDAEIIVGKNRNGPPAPLTSLGEASFAPVRQRRRSPAEI